MAELLKPADAAARLHISERTLRELKRTGAVRYVAVSGRSIRYRPDDLADYINSRVRCDDQQPRRVSRRSVSLSPRANNVVSLSEALANK